MSDLYPCAIWLTGRFLYAPSASELSVVDPDDILARVGLDAETEISKMLRGGNSSAVTAMCCGAVAIRNHAPARAWIAASALLRSPVATKKYLEAIEFCDERQDMIQRLAKVLAREGKLAAHEALWIADQPPRRLAS
jgi:hypothetical protein